MPAARNAGRPQRADRGHHRADAASVQHAGASAARNPARARVHRSWRAGRLLPARRARWLAPRRLLHQSARHRRVAEIHAADSELSRRRAGPSLAGLDPARVGLDPLHPQRAAWASAPSAKAGASTPNSSPTNSASMPTTRSAAWAICNRRRSAPRAWWSTPACTPSAGRREQAIQSMMEATGDQERSRHHRDRALLRVARPSLQLHGRPPSHQPHAATARANSAGRALRPQGLPRHHARQRRGAALGAGTPA